MRPTVSKCEPLTRSLSTAPLYLYLNLRVGLWTFLVETICSPYSGLPTLHSESFRFHSYWLQDAEENLT